MKKISIILLLLVISFTTLFSVSNALADGRMIDPSGQGLEPNVCCELRHDIDIDGDGTKDFSKDDVVGSPDGGCCSIVNTKVCGDPGTVGYTSTPHWAGLCMLDAIVTIADWIFYITGLVAVVALAFAGLMFVTSAGNPDRVGKAKSIFLYSLIGVLVAVCAKFIPALARFFIGI